MLGEGWSGENSKRGMSMLRMGKREMMNLPPLVPPSFDVPKDLEVREVRRH